MACVHKPSHPLQLRPPGRPAGALTAVGIAAHGIGAGRQGHHLVVRRVADGGLHIQVVDNEVGLVPPAWGGGEMGEGTYMGEDGGWHSGWRVDSNVRGWHQAAQREGRASPRSWGCWQPRAQHYSQYDYDCKNTIRPPAQWHPKLGSPSLLASASSTWLGSTRLSWKW